MSECALFVSLATTGNKTPDCHDSIVLLHAEAVEFSATDAIKKLTVHKDAVPDEKMMPSSMIFTGLNSKDLALNASCTCEQLANMLSRLLQNAVNKDMLIVGWNVIEDILKPLDRRYGNTSLCSDATLLAKVLDVKQLAEKIIPVDDVGAYGIDAVLLSMSDDFLQLQSFLSLRFGIRYSEVMLNLTMLVLKLLMLKANLKSLSEVLLFIKTPKVLDVFTFGKHRGKCISDVFKTDHKYIDWLYSCKDLMSQNADLKLTLEQLLSVD